MARSILSRYVDAETLTRLGDRRLDPRGLVLGSMAGAHRSLLAGFAVEFSGHREYAWGDDPRHIDWRVYFTRDKYFIKQYEMETNFVCHLIIDVSASMRYGDGLQQKLLHAATLATTLGHAVIRQSDKVSLATFDDSIRGWIPPSGAMAQIVRMAEHLDQLQPAQETKLPECLSQLLARMQRREILMVFSDFFTDLDALEESLQRMRFQQHEVVLFQIMHHDELNFDFSGTVKFVGVETAEEFVTQPQDVRAAYLQAVENFNSRFAELCYRNHVERVLVDTSRNMAETVIDYLNHRSLLNRGR